MKSNFSQGETLLARFSGNFVDQITPENIFFYRGHVPTFMLYDVAKINEDFYVYALLTEKTEGNYSISIEGVRYMKAAQTVEDNIVKNFTITNDTAAFSITPGFVKTNGNFYLALQNLQDSSITVSYGLKKNSSSSESKGFFASLFGGSDSKQTGQDSITINSGASKKVNFFVENFSQGLNTIELSSINTSYSIPVYFDANVSSNGTSENTSETNENSLEFQPSTVEVSMATNSNTKRILYLTNTGGINIENISFNISSILGPYLVVYPEKIDSLEPGSNEKIEIQIVSDKQEAVIEGKITAYAENFSSSLNIILDFVKDYIPAEGINETKPVILTTCEEIKGIKCAENFVCGEEIIQTKDGDCCLTTCTEPQKSYTGTIIGWLLLILLIIIVIWFFKRKYSRVGKRKPF
jgi:hypothetical protein